MLCALGTPLIVKVLPFNSANVFNFKSNRLLLNILTYRISSVSKYLNCLDICGLKLHVL